MGSEWIISITNKCENWIPHDDACKWMKRSIYRVPNYIRDVNREAYTPQIVSIGPYHHGLDHLEPMEPHKHRALYGFLRRTKKLLTAIVEAMKRDVVDLKESYERLEKPWTNDDKFVELMILDSCFLMEALIEIARHLKNEHSMIYDKDDPVFGRVPFWIHAEKDAEKDGRWTLWTKLFMDLLMIENQLPLRTVSILMEVGALKIDESIAKVLASGGLLSDKRDNNLEGLHILDAIRNNLLRNGQYKYSLFWNIQSATELQQSGVRFKKKETKCLKDIIFDNGILLLPKLEYDRMTEPIFLNLLAYEHLRFQCTADGLASYFFFMDGLIDTAKDVSLLRQKEIIIAMVGNNEDIASFFDRITKAFPLKGDFDSGVDVDVNWQLRMYCRKRLNKWRASFLQTYSSNPWVFLSLLGALVLLILSTLQTAYTMLPYYHPSKSH